LARFPPYLHRRVDVEVSVWVPGVQVGVLSVGYAGVATVVAVQGALAVLVGVAAHRGKQALAVDILGGVYAEAPEQRSVDINRGGDRVDPPAVAIGVVDEKRV